MDFSNCVNALERLVFEQIEMIMPKISSCTCQRCMCDVAAIVLNRIKPAYSVSLQGDLIIKLNAMKAQYAADITANIVFASELVSKNPRHDVVLRDRDEESKEM